MFKGSAKWDKRFMSTASLCMPTPLQWIQKHAAAAASSAAGAAAAAAAGIWAGKAGPGSCCRALYFRFCISN